MGQVTVTLNGRAYRLSCGDGEEERLTALADHVRSKLETLVAQFGQPGNDRLMLIADELWDARGNPAKAETAKPAVREPAKEPSKDPGRPQPQKAAS